MRRPTTLSGMAETPAFGLWYDFRNPDPDRPFGRFYGEVLDQIAWAEQRGLDSVWLTEHHFVDDGYSPSPFVLGAAIATRTSRMRIGTNLIVSPLHDPIRLAEDAATLSLLSGGRFDLGVGQGYWDREFRAFGRSLKNRPSLLEEGVEIIRRSWSGSAEGYTGQALLQAGAPGHAAPGADAPAARRRAGRPGDRTRRADRRRLPVHPERAPGVVPGGVRAAGEGPGRGQDLRRSVDRDRRGPGGGLVPDRQARAVPAQRLHLLGRVRSTSRSSPTRRRSSRPARTR